MAVLLLRNFFLSFWNLGTQGRVTSWLDSVISSADEEIYRRGPCGTQERQHYRKPQWPPSWQGCGRVASVKHPLTNTDVGGPGGTCVGRCAGAGCPHWGERRLANGGWMLAWFFLQGYNIVERNTLSWRWCK